MEQPPFISHRRDEPEFSLREWAAKAKIGRDPAISRRFSGSYIRSFREDARSLRSNVTAVTSTASSPGYPFGDEINPATYSFTNAIKALQARSLNSWECFSLDGFTLNSKWNEAEKYICNPLSGEVPMECLSAKSLSGRSFKNLANRIAISAPLVYSNHSQIGTKPYSISQLVQKLPIPENKVEANGMTRDVGTQSTPPVVGSNSPSPASTPPIVERALKRCELEEDSPNSNSKSTPETEVIRRELNEERAKEEEKEVVHRETIAEEKFKQGGCLSWMMKKKKQKEEERSRRKRLICHLKLKGC
ncbi:uncharacterized protein LOC111492625 isoform X1 [Cucurbita maxima]|uniref:Uncharacterized protein LOC111492625 isoform X1 n=1 Tax=Cucurbita maxima TaxID=3661 RepID=A0A6J1KAU1_CUCMA|nr:uncharacterized protein LOC111492625 isoform X1 [Cucurbita maxima]